MDNVAAVGSGTTWARADHVHPVDTSRYAATNPSGYQTSAQVTAVLPVASSTLPLVAGTAAIGASAKYAREDHVHPVSVVTVADTPPTIANGLLWFDSVGTHLYIGYNDGNSTQWVLIA
jgi:hypothetical protein